MSITGIDSLDRSLQKTNIWLKEIMEALGWSNKLRAYLALRAVLHAIRDRLTPEEASDLAAELPLVIRGIFYEGWSAAGKPVRMNREDFINRVGAYFRHDAMDIDPELVARVVLSVLSRSVSQGEIEDIKSILPKDLKELLPEREKAHA